VSDSESVDTAEPSPNVQPLGSIGHGYYTRAASRRIILAMRRIGRKYVGRDYVDNPTLVQALRSPSAVDWIAAIQKELEQLKARETWELVLNVPPGTRLLPCHFVLRQKRHADGSEDKKKARLVVGGNFQPAELYGDTASPTARMISIKTLLQLAVQQDYFITTYDVPGAFLHSTIDKDIYIRVPAFDKYPGFIAKLKKGMYGLKQAGKLWFDELAGTLQEFGCVRSQFDPAVWSYFGPDGNHLYIAVHVDDLLVVSTDEQGPAALSAHIGAKYDCELTESDGSSHLGLSIERNEETGEIVIRQPGLTSKILEELDLDVSALAVDTPMATIPPVTSSDSPFPDTSKYSRVVGMLLYLTHSRPDILYAVSILSTKNQSPTVTHWKAAQRVGRYLLGTKDLGLHFRKNADGILLHGYADAAFATHEDARSHTGYTANLVPGSAPVYAASKKQSITAQSSTEAEFEALRNEATLAVWLKDFLGDLGYEQTSPVVIYEDNKATIHLAHKDGNWGRTRHFGVRYHFVRDKLEDHTIDLVYIPTVHQVADILTKPLPGNLFSPLRDILLGIKPNPFIQSRMIY
jgi:Reverse transcriptase (RNA-dependent DNA polymerase)